MTDAATARQERVFNAALSILFHRFGTNADVFTKGPEAGAQMSNCVRVAADLNAQVESALGAPQPF